jgi:hypothetical protein
MIATLVRESDTLDAIVAAVGGASGVRECRDVRYVLRVISESPGSAIVLDLDTLTASQKIGLSTGLFSLKVWPPTAVLISFSAMSLNEVIRLFPRSDRVLLIVKGYDDVEKTVREVMTAGLFQTPADLAAWEIVREMDFGHARKFVAACIVAGKRRRTVPEVARMAGLTGKGSERRMRSVGLAPPERAVALGVVLQGLYLNERYGLSVKKVGKKIGMSPQAYCNLVHRATGQTPAALAERVGWKHMMSALRLLLSAKTLKEQHAIIHQLER